jgi:hypothetical protein
MQGGKPYQQISPPVFEIPCPARAYSFSFKYPHLLLDPDAPRKLAKSTRLRAFNPDDFEVFRMALGIQKS